LYLTESALKDLRDPQSATNLLGLRGFIQSSLTRWVAGERVFADRGEGAFLKRLDPPPPEIWEIRITEPVVHARLFGRFAEADTLILTKFHTRRLLGRKGSADWKSAMLACESTWSALFPAHRPFVGLTIQTM
jgi:hypothetical protein